MVAITLDRWSVPTDEQFEADDLDFLSAGDLYALATKIMREHGNHLAVDILDDDKIHVTYLWKRKGGSSGGKVRLGACQKLSGVAKYYAGQDFLIWLAADHCAGYTPKQIEALLFHELCHLALDDQDKPILVGHDYEGFYAELQAFGFWKEDLAELGRVVQARLFDADET